MAADECSRNLSRRPGIPSRAHIVVRRQENRHHGNRKKVGHHQFITQYTLERGCLTEKLLAVLGLPKT